MLKIEKVFERDMDLYIINKFINDNKTKELFLNKIGLKDYEVVECIHSFSDENGESDITIVLSNGEEKIGLLIEDKISAIAMPNQCDRYKLRGDKLIKDKVFDKYFIFIIAPEDYLKNNSEALKYDNRVSYEEVLETIKGDLFGEDLIKEAISEKKKGYSVIENKNVTYFWQRYYDLVEEKYPTLVIRRNNSPRGSDACWPIFITPIIGVQIFHKSDRGFVDLTFPNLADKYYEVKEKLNYILNDEYTLQKAGKSLAIRKKVSTMDFKEDFDEQIELVIEALDAVKNLYELLEKIDYNSIVN